MKTGYTTLDQAEIALTSLNAEERRFLGRMMRNYKENVSYLDFENLCSEAPSPLFAQAKRLGRHVQETPLYRICDDLGKRLGIRQGFLVREEVVDRYASPTASKEFTTGETAKLAACTDEAVRKAIRTGRLRARRVGRFSLIREEDARAFAAARGKAGGRGP